jgi:uncharacterized membrane protein YfhO
MHRIQDFGEYLPKTVQKLPDKSKAGRIAVKSGQARIFEGKKYVDKMTFEAMVDTQTEITVGMFYYPSWKAKANKEEIPLSTDEEGLIQMKLSKGKHRVEVYFDHSRARWISMYVSLLSAFVLLAVAVFSKKVKKPMGGKNRI